MLPSRLDTSLEALVERLATLTQPAALATIVATAGSTYRKAGARMLIEHDGRLTGLLSGGCLEHDLREYARQVIQRGAAHVVDYDLRDADDPVFGLGAGCEGAMRILLEPVAATGSLALALAGAAQRLALGSPVALAVTHAAAVGELGTRVWPTDAPLDAPLASACAHALAEGACRAERLEESGGVREAWIQYVAPPPHILVCGAGPDAEPLVALLRTLRLPVSVVDHRPAYAAAARFPGASVHLAPAAELARRIDLTRCFAAVVMSHHLESDARYLAALADSPIAHVGLLGPRHRRERLLADLGDAAARLRPRLRGPVGLDIGAVTPEGIALAIAAQLHALAAGHTAAAQGAAP